MLVILNRNNMSLIKKLLLPFFCVVALCMASTMLGAEAENQEFTITAIFESNGNSYVRLSNRNTFVINKKTDSFFTKCTNSISNWLAGDTVQLVRGKSISTFGEQIPYPFKIKNLKTNTTAEAAISNEHRSNLDINDTFDALFDELEKLNKKIAALQFEIRKIKTQINIQ